MSDELTAVERFDTHAMAARRPVGEASTAAAQAGECAPDEPDASFGVDEMFQTIMI